MPCFHALEKVLFGVDVDHLMLTLPLPYAFLSAAFLTQTVCLDDTTVKFEIWDTAGQERYHSLAPMYYRGAQAAIVVYDITNEAHLLPTKLLIQFSHSILSRTDICHIHALKMK